MTDFHPRTDRYESLDVLRGVAVLGILMVNMQAFAMIPEAYMKPNLQAPWDAAGQASWVFVETFFTFKFVTLFSAMFGAGIVLMLGEEKVTDRLSIHRARMGWLLVIGLLHAYVLWFGDILVPYAVAGLIAAGARRWSIRRLVAVALVLLALNALVFVSKGAMAFMPAEDYAEVLAELHLSPEQVAEQTAIYRSDWLTRWPEAASFTLQVQLSQLFAFLPRIIGVMMLGMAAYKSGALLARWPAWVYAVLALVCIPIGAAASHWAAGQRMAAGFDLVETVPGMQALYWGSVVQALGYGALVMLACKPAMLRLARVPFAAAGRMAFSNYLGCTLAGVLIFLGPPGAGLIGALDRPAQIGLTLVFWAVMLIVSPVWLSMFRYGPMEWLWRSLTYGAVQPMRKVAKGVRA